MELAVSRNKQAEAFWASNLAPFSCVVLSACANTTNLSLTNKNSEAREFPKSIMKGGGMGKEVMKHTKQHLF